MLLLRAELSSSITSTLFLCVHISYRRPPFATANQAVLTSQLVCTSGGKYLASAGSRISDYPSAQSLHKSQYSDCFIRRINYVTVKERPKIQSYQCTATLLPTPFRAVNHDISLQTPHPVHKYYQILTHSKCP
jgi:hypothetical protein